MKLKHEWQKRRIVNEADQLYLQNLVKERGLIIVGPGAGYASFEVAAQFQLGPNGQITGIHRLALLGSKKFVEILK